MRLTVREGQRVATRVSAPDEVEGPIDAGQRLGRAVVTVDGERRAAVPLLAVSAAPEASLAQRVDTAIPGSRAAAWLLLIAVIAIVLIGAVAVVGRARRR